MREGRNTDRRAFRHEAQRVGDPLSVAAHGTLDGLVIPHANPRNTGWVTRSMFRGAKSALSGFGDQNVRMHRTETSNVLVIGTGAAGSGPRSLPTRPAASRRRRQAPAPRRPHRPRLRRHQRGARHPRPRGLLGAALRRHASRGLLPRRPADRRDHGPRGAGGRPRARGRGAASSRAPRTAASTSGSSAPTAGVAPATPATTPDGRSWHAARQGRADLGIPRRGGQYVSQLLVADGACFGALAFDLHTGDRTVFLADAVVLCGGGHTRLWRRSSSRRDENFGDGMPSRCAPAAG